MNDTKISLKKFIEENHILLSALAVFAALSAFLSRLTINWLNGVLSFVFIGGLIIIFFEIRSRFPKDNEMSLRLFLFRYVIVLGLGGVLLYWLLAFRTFWNVFLAIPLFFLFVFLINSFFKPIAEIGFLIKIIGIGQKKNAFQRFIGIMYLIFLILTSFVIAILFTPPLNIIFDIIKNNFR